jgi:hypothetical protein
MLTRIKAAADRYPRELRPALALVTVGALVAAVVALLGWPAIAGHLIWLVVLLALLLCEWCARHPAPWGAGLVRAVGRGLVLVATWAYPPPPNAAAAEQLADDRGPGSPAPAGGGTPSQPARSGPAAAALAPRRPDRRRQMRARLDRMLADPALRDREFELITRGFYPQRGGR